MFHPIHKLKALLLTTTILTLPQTIVPANAQTTYYVNGACGDDTWTGTTSVCQPPDGPKATIQMGIDAAIDGDTVIVADGTYTGDGNRDLDFGGRLITLRSANGPNTCIIDCQESSRGFSFVGGETADAVVDGLTITNCTASSGSPDGGGAGGGMFVENSSPTITDCVFANNWVWSFFHPDAALGGGMYNLNSSPTLTNCTFVANSAEGAFESRHLGGAMYNFNSNPQLTNCTFLWNEAFMDAGGAMYNEHSRPVLTNCTFSANIAWYGILFNDSSSTPSLLHCILWNDDVKEIYDAGGSVTTVRYNDVQGGWPGEGNIDADPLFVDADNSNLRLLPNSPCIEAGDPDFVPEPGALDLDGHARVLCGRVDMGAYEFGIGDFDCDRDVDVFDFAAYLDCVTGAADGELPPGCEAFDFNGDNDVDFHDLGGFQRAFTGAP